jgi:hypothetical protein
MSADLTAMQEAIRTIADAVGELSKTCEGLPKFLEAQIGAFRAEMTTALAGVAEKYTADRASIDALSDSLGAQVAELASKVEVTKDALLKSVEDVTTQAGQIIADNRREIEAQITESYGEAHQKLMTSIDESTKREAELRGLIAETRSACDTVDLHHGLATVKGDIANISKSLGEATIAIDSDGKAIADLHKTLGAIGPEHGTVADAIAAAVSPLRETMAASEAKQAEATATNAALLGERIGAIAGQLATVEQAATASETRTTDEIAAVRKELTDADLSIRKDAWEEITKRFDFDQLALKSHKESIEALQNTVTEFKAVVPNLIAEAVAPVAESVAEVRGVVEHNATAAEQKFGAIHMQFQNDSGHLQRLDEGQNSLHELTQKLAVDTPNKIAEAVAPVAEAVQSVRTLVTDHYDMAASEFKTITERLVSDAEQIGMLVKAEQQQDERISHMAVGTANRIGEVKTALEASIAETAAAAREEAKGLTELVTNTAKAVDQVDNDLKLVNGKLVETGRMLDSRFVALETASSSNLEFIAAVKEAAETGQHILLERVERLSTEYMANVQGIRTDLESVGAQLPVIEERMVAVLNRETQARGTEYSELKEATEIAIGVYQTRTDELESSITHLGERVGTVHTELQARIQGVSGSLQDYMGATDKQISEAEARSTDFARTVVAEAAQGMAEVTKTLLSREDADTVYEEMSKSFTSQFVGVAGLVNEVSQTVKELAEANVETIKSVEELRGEVKAIEPGVTPEQLAELKAQPAQPPAAEFQVRFDDGKFVIDMEYEYNGEKKTVSTVVPLNIGVEYRGVYRADQTYPAGHMVSHKGSVWYSRGTATGEPGKDFTGWQLAVKRGADGKSPDPIRTYTKHDDKNVYKESDFLRINNRLWQCAVKETRTVPEPGDIRSTPEWLLIGGVQ